jgi:CheY-like chemotaxis protein
LAPTNGPLTGLSILIVEDEPLVAMMAEEFADELGCEIRQTEVSTLTALAAIDAFSPDIAVVDVNLNSLGASYEVADRLMERSIPFVFSSGHHPSELPARYEGHRFLAKPFSIEEFSAAIASVRT